MGVFRGFVFQYLHDKTHKHGSIQFISLIRKRLKDLVELSTDIAINTDVIV